MSGSEDSRPLVSIIIPTYNEAENIVELIRRLTDTLQTTPFEIIVVDDNSPDKTWEVVEDLALREPRVRVIRRVAERGLSSAVTTGMATARGRSFAVMDADLQHDESILPEMVGAVTSGQFDVCIGSRAS